MQYDKYSWALGKSLGIISFVLLLIPTACTSKQDPSSPLVIISGSNDHAGAIVIMDDIQVGKLSRWPFPRRLFWKILSKPEFFPDEIASLSIDVSNLEDGEHHLRVSSGRKDLISVHFVIPLSENPTMFSCPDLDQSSGGP